MMSEKPIRILNIVPNMRAAGVETFVMNIYRNIDRNKVQFDFLVHSQKEEFYDKAIEKLGGKIYRLTLKDDKNIFKYINDLNSFFKKHQEYKIVHGHMQSMMPLYLYIAKINNVPIRIAHSHNSNYEKTIKGIILHLFSRFSKYPSTHNIACSKVAGRYLFGHRNFEIIYNGIDLDKYKFNKSVREKIRSEMHCDDKFIIGHVGRFERQKNHKFIIDILEKLKDQNVEIWMVGEGSKEKEIKKLAEQKRMGDKIRFLGVREDVNNLYQAMDCFVLPSLYEGLPLVGIEAQISGLSCLFSNKITEELKLSNKAKYLGIKSIDIDIWKRNIIKLMAHGTQERRNIPEMISFFDITMIARELKNRYIKYSTESYK